MEVDGLSRDVAQARDLSLAQALQRILLDERPGLSDSALGAACHSGGCNICHGNGDRSIAGSLLSIRMWPC